MRKTLTREERVTDEAPSPLKTRLYFLKEANDAHRRVAGASPEDLETAYLDLQACAEDTEDPGIEPTMRQLYADVAALCWNHSRANKATL